MFASYVAVMGSSRFKDFWGKNLCPTDNFLSKRHNDK